MKPSPLFVCSSDLESFFSPIVWLRWSRIIPALSLLLVTLVCGPASSATAQTAHFAGAQSTVGSQFNEPDGVAVDVSGNVYVADAQAFAIYELLAVNGTLPASPIVKTLASGLSNPEGVAVDVGGNVYFTDLDTSQGVTNGSVKEILAVKGSIPASPTIIRIGSGFFLSWGVAVDVSGNVYVADTNNNAVKEILAVNGFIPASPTIITLGSGFSAPQGVAIDGRGDVYIADKSDHAVKEILAVNGSIPASPTINTLAGGLCSPYSVAVDGSGNVYFPDYCNKTVYEILAVNGSIPASPMINKLGNGYNYPESVAVDGNGDVYVVGSVNGYLDKISLSSGNFGQVRAQTTSPAISMVFTFDTGGTLGSTAVLTQGATGLDFTDAGGGTCQANTAYAAGQTCYVNVNFRPRFAGTRFGAAVLRNTSGNTIATGFVQGTGVGPQLNFVPGTQSTVLAAGLNYPTGVAVDASGDIYISDLTEHLVLKETPSAGGTTQSTVIHGSYPAGIALDGSGNLYIGNWFGYGVIKETISAQGYAGSLIGADITSPEGVAVDGEGDLFISNGSATIFKEAATADPDVYIESTLPISGAGAYQVAVDGSGNLYITDPVDGQVLKETLSGGSYTQSTLVSGLGDLNGLAVDGSGNVYVVNSFNDQVLKMTPSTSGYTQSIVANYGSGGLDQPWGVAVDGKGGVFITDSNNKRVLEFDFSVPPSLTFGSTPVGTASADSPQTVTLANNGNAALNFPIPATGDNPSIGAYFNLGSSGPNACPLVSSGSFAPGELAAGSSCELPITFTPTAIGAVSSSLMLTDTNLNAPAPGYATQAISLNGTATIGTPTITWPTPAPITVGTALSATQLNASANVSGTFVYTPPAGSIPAQGADTLSVAFTPTDTADYTTATQTVQLTVSPAVPAAIISPAPSSTLTGPKTTFAWTPGTGATGYYLWVGTTPGGYDLANVGIPSGTSATVNLPTNGATIYVRLNSVINGTQIYNSYTYTEANIAAAVMTSPSPGSTLTGATTTFTWTAGNGATAYYLWVGTTPGGYDLANLGVPSGTSATVNLPTNGATIYVRLNSVINGTQIYNSYTYTEAAAATMTSPAPGSTLTGATTTFTWTAGTGATGYYLWVGTTPGGYDLANVGIPSGTSATVNLPTNGAPIYVRLNSVINGTQIYNSYTYTEANIAAAVMTSPSTGSTLTGATTTFTWTAGTGATGYYLWVGTTPGGYDLANVGIPSGTSATVNLPTNGATIYVRLNSVINGTQIYNSYTYTEANIAAAVMTSPSPGAR